MYIFVVRLFGSLSITVQVCRKIDFHFQKHFAKIGRAGAIFFIDPVNFFSGCIDSI